MGPWGSHGHGSASWESLGFFWRDVQGGIGRSALEATWRLGLHTLPLVGGRNNDDVDNDRSRQSIHARPRRHVYCLSITIFRWDYFRVSRTRETSGDLTYAN